MYLMAINLGCNSFYNIKQNDRHVVFHDPDTGFNQSNDDNLLTGCWENTRREPQIHNT